MTTVVNASIITIGDELLIGQVVDTNSAWIAHKHGSVDDVITSGAYRQFYMHRTSHWMGMDVHDRSEERRVGKEC